MSITKYVGPEPGKMTDEDAERLRRNLPDSPVRLPDGHLACRACGVAVPDPKPPIKDPEIRKALGLGPYWEPSPRFGDCAECAGVHEQAREYVEAHPGFAARVGPDIAVERVASVLFGLSIIGQRAPDDLAFLLRRMQPVAHGVWFSNPTALVRDRCSPHPFAHVPLGQRAELRKAYAASMRDRLALGQPPVAVPCPTGGCLLCGIASVPRAAVEIAQRGTHGIWREVNASPKALGSNGPERIWGHVCPSCADAIEQAGGAVGWSARVVAVINYLGRIEPKKALRLKTEVEADARPILLAWRAMPNRRPSAEPWAHLRRSVFSRL